MSDRELWSRVRPLLERLLEASGAERDALLDSIPEGEVRAELLTLLRHETEARGFLAPEPELPAAPPGAGLVTPERIADFQLLELLGTGGTGAVYAAEQDSPRRRVALKLLRVGFQDEERRRRFVLESEVQGDLRHPGIAHLYGAGTWREGEQELPWFALELVEGARPLTRYAVEKGLSLEECLRLFLQVGEAIAHAHAKGVVHRDLKPSNLLVDRAGRVKVIDFGCARGDEAPEGRALTQTGEIIGTLAYLAPEQFERGSRLADARDDVYSLGVILYELVAGRLPIDVDGSLPLVIDRVRRERVRPPSHWRPGVPEELDWVALRALEKDRERRYSSVAELAADLRRFLDDEPVLARPPSRRYLLRKYVHRHRFLATAVAVFGLALVGWAITAGVLLARAASARADVELREEHLQLAQDFYDETVFAVDATELGPETRMADVLRASAARLEKASLPPEVAVSIHQSLGSTFHGLGAFDAAKRELEAALAKGATLDDYAEADRLAVLTDLAHTNRELALWKDARRVAEESYAGSLELFGGEDERTLSSALILCSLHRELGEWEAARELLDRSWADSRRAHGPGSPIHLHFVLARSRWFADTGDMQRAEELAEEASVGLEAKLGPTHPETLEARTTWAQCLTYRSRFERAVEVMQPTWERQLEVHGPDHARTLRAAAGLGAMLDYAGRSAEAIELLQDAIERLEDSPEPDQDALWTARTNLASALTSEREYDAADELHLSVLDHTLETEGELSEGFLICLNNYGRFLEKAGRAVEATGFFERLVEQVEEALPKPTPVKATFYMNRGRNLLKTGDSDAAEAPLLRALEVFEATGEGEAAASRSIHTWLIDYYRQQGDREALAIHRRALEASGEQP